MVVDRTLYDILGVETNATRPQLISVRVDSFDRLIRLFS